MDSRARRKALRYPDFAMSETAKQMSSVPKYFGMLEVNFQDRKAQSFGTGPWSEV